MIFLIAAGEMIVSFVISSHRFHMGNANNYFLIPTEESPWKR